MASVSGVPSILAIAERPFSPSMASSEVPSIHSAPASVSMGVTVASANAPVSSMASASARTIARIHLFIWVSSSLKIPFYYSCAATACQGKLPRAGRSLDGEKLAPDGCRTCPAGSKHAIANTGDENLVLLAAGATQKTLPASHAERVFLIYRKAGNSGFPPQLFQNPAAPREGTLVVARAERTDDHLPGAR